MSDTRTNLSEYEAIAKTVQHYIDGARSGRSADMQPAFHQEATIFGYADGDLFAGPIQLLFDYVDHDAPATGLHARIVGIDLVDMHPAGSHRHNVFQGAQMHVLGGFSRRLKQRHAFRPSRSSS